MARFTRTFAAVSAVAVTRTAFTALAVVFSTGGAFCVGLRVQCRVCAVLSLGGCGIGGDHIVLAAIATFT